MEIQAINEEIGDADEAERSAEALRRLSAEADRNAEAWKKQLEAFLSQQASDTANAAAANEALQAARYYDVGGGSGGGGGGDGGGGIALAAAAG